MKCSANKEWVDTNLFMWLLRGPVPEIRNVLLFQPQWNIRSDLYLLHHKHSFVLCLMNSLTYPRTHTRAREWKYMLKQIQVWFVEYSSRCFMFYRGRGVYLKGSASPKRNMCNRGYGPRISYHIVSPLQHLFILSPILFLHPSEALEVNCSSWQGLWYAGEGSDRPGKLYWTKGVSGH